MSAATDLDAARSAVAEANAALVDLTARIDAGDSTVTGADLATAEAAVTVATRLEAGATTRAAAEQAEANRKAAALAVADLVATHKATSGDLSDAIGKAIDSLSAALTVAEDQRQTMRTKLQAAMSFGPNALGADVHSRLSSGVAPGCGRLIAPTTEEIIAAIPAVAAKAVGKTTSSYPHLTIEPIRPYLPAES